MDTERKKSPVRLAWREPLYVGPGILSREKKIRKRLDQGKTDIGHYLITIASNGVDELDIVPTAFLGREMMRARLPLIVGLASDRREALDMLLEITGDCLRETGTLQLKKWLLEVR